MELSDKEFELFQKFIFKEIGISLANSKKFLVKNRLLKRVLEYNLTSYGDYYRLIQVNNSEKTEMLNLITTNETYFFREQSHFDFFEEEIIPNFKDSKLRIWSAASSVGAEAYTLAMVSNDQVYSYEIFGSDINSEVVKKANVGLYPIKWMDKIPQEYKVKYCLKGKGKHEGWFLVDRSLIRNMKFEVRNLMDIQRDLGKFDVIFLRNVLIYFNNENKEKLLNNVLENLKVGGYLFISLTENIRHLEIKNLEQVQSSIFRKVE